MAVGKQKLIATGFALVGVISLVAAVLPAIKGQSLNITFLGIGVIWLIVSVVVLRKPGGRAV
jgi:NhaP-type Na+/H+ or K+/H+ antiporter